MPPHLDDRNRTRSRRRLRPLAATSAVTSAALLSVVLAGTAAHADDTVGTTFVGELVQAWAEPDGHAHGADEAAPAPLSWVETASGDAVPVDAGDVVGLPPGSTVSVTVGDGPTDEGGPAQPVLDAEVLSAPPVASAPAGPLTNQVTVAMVAPAGAPAGPRPGRERIVELVDGPVAEFWAGETGGAVALGVTASHDWISTAAGCATPAALWSEVAARVGFVPGPGQHLLLFVPPRAPGCAYALAEVGSARTSGGRLYVSDTSSSVIAHELGHNFGLAHSSGQQCDGTVETGGCRTVAYRDLYDVMGASWAHMGSLNVVHAAALGVLPERQVQRVPRTAGTTTATLAPLSGRSGVRALRLTDAVGVDYWLEYRPATGRDAWLGTDADPFGLDTGVLLRRAGSFPDTSVLLDGTPSTAGGWDADRQAALRLGAPVSIAGGQFTVEVRDVTAAGATLAVTPDPGAATDGVPLPPAADTTGILSASRVDPAPAAIGAPTATTAAEQEEPTRSAAGQQPVEPTLPAAGQQPVEPVPAALRAASRTASGMDWSGSAAAAVGLAVLALSGCLVRRRRAVVRTV